MLKKRDSDFGELEGAEIDGSLLESNDTASKNLIPVIYQSGYLTIKDYDKKSNIYKLGFPNKHVKNAFMTLMKYIQILCDGRKLVKVGVNFSYEKRNVERWIVK